MATTTIPWGDGSGDNIYLTYPSASGDQTVEVSSDANTGSARTKTVTFSATGVTPVTLTVNQDAGAITPIFYTYLYFDGQSYITTDLSIPTNGSVCVPVGYETLKAAQQVFRFSGGSTGYIAHTLTSNTTSTNRRMGVYYDSSSLTASNRNLSFTNYSAYGFFLTPKGYGWGNVYYTYTKGSQHPTGPLQVGGWGTGQHYTGRMSTMTIYGSDAQNCNSKASFESYTPVYTLRPCTYNGEAGLWCVENNQFYGNSAGAGTLVAANS